MLVAKEGYAVGGIVACVGDLITGMKIVFMRLEQGRLNAKDSYESEWVGATFGDIEVSCISSDGRPIVGITSFAGSHVDGLMLVPAEPNRAALKQKADQLARHYRFAEAVPLYSELATAFPTESFYFLLHAEALLESGDLPAYQALCHDGLLRLEDSTDMVAARRVSKSCLLGPLDPADLKTACELADQALAAQLDAPNLVHARLGKGLAELRLGHFREAIGALKQVIDTAGNSGAPAPRQIEAAAYAALAMAHQGCGQNNEARAALDKASQIVKEDWPPTASADLGANWQEAVMAHILFTEAAKKISQ
jgi:tetratricopeptide (TPR) repeat protein